jgi:peroxiredoxin
VSTISDRSEATAWQKRHEPGSPKVGETAPDFELSDVDGKNPVRLSSFRGERPVALVFGSYT